MEYKTCIRCGISKPLTEFHIYNNKPTSKCKECQKQYQKEYRKRKPEPRKKRRRRYIKESLETGMRYRVGLKYVLDMPTTTHQKCTKCGQWKTLEHFRVEKKYKHRSTYRRTICKECDKKPKKVRDSENHPITCSTCGKRFKKREYMLIHHQIIHGTGFPRKRKSPEEIKCRNKERHALKRCLHGDGCCLYCGETDFWKLNNHHPWKEIDPNFTITLCENHHAAFTRNMPFILEEWNNTKR